MTIRTLYQTNQPLAVLDRDQCRALLDSRHWYGTPERRHEDAEISDCCEEGASLVEIARYFGRTPRTIRAALKREGWRIEEGRLAA